MSQVMEEEIKRWTARRKSALVLEIIQGKTTVAEASRQFDLTPSEVESWVDDGKRGMENALRAKPEDVREQYDRQLNVSFPDPQTPHKANFLACVPQPGGSMKKSRFTETQIVSILKQADAGVPVKDICRQAGISVPTYYKWKSKYGGLEASELRRVKDLEAENARLKRMYAELALDNAAMKDLIAKKL